MKSNRTIKLTIGIASLLIAALALSACGPPETPTATPTDTPEPEIILASQDSITIGEFKFQIVTIAFESSVFGMEPAGMKSSQTVMFVEFELLSGDQGAFKGLSIIVTDGSSLNAYAVALITGGQVNTLSSLTYTGAETSYKPDENNIVWAYVVPQGASELFLVFPSGEMVNLSPLLP